jgi:uncharacterized protein
MLLLPFVGACGRRNLLHVPEPTMLSTRSGRVLAEHLRWARSPAARRRGLLGAPQLEAGEALVIAGAPQVHTFGMRYPIDVLFCSSDWTVLHVVHSMKPRRVSRWVRRARYAVEMPAGAAAGVKRGDVLELR